MIVEICNNTKIIGLTNAAAFSKVRIIPWNPKKQKLSEFKPDTVFIGSNHSSQSFNGTKQHKLFFVNCQQPIHAKPNMENLVLDDYIDTIMFPDGNPSDHYKGKLNYFSGQDIDINDILPYLEDIKMAGPVKYFIPEYIGKMNFNEVIGFLKSADKALCFNNFFLNEMSYYGINIVGATPKKGVKTYMDFVKEL